MLCAPTGVESGTVKLRVALPKESVVAPDAVTWFPPTSTVSKVVAKKPDTEVVTRVPGGPLPGFNPPAEGVIVNEVAD